MDFVTHALVGAGAARLISPRREWIPQLSLAAILAAELQDSDPWLYLIHPSYYGRYHRVATHNLWALALVALACAGLAWLITRVKPWRRFGWFVANNLPRMENPPDHPRFGWFVLVSLAGAYLHFAGDVITGFGNIMPFWPWSSRDVSLAAVSSFDAVIFSLTLGWNISLRWFTLPRRREAILSLVYLVIVVVYVVARKLWGSPTVW